jgi:hypothetical protein
MDIENAIPIRQPTSMDEGGAAAAAPAFLHLALRY